MDENVNEIISDLRSYLGYLKEMGISFLPALVQNSEKAILPGILTLADVREELGDCKRCKLHRTRRTIVYGEGNEKASQCSSERPLDMMKTFKEDPS